MKSKKEEKPKKETGYIKPRSIVEEMEESYLDYAMSVIIARALPDARDGLKPVHRRILYAMHGLGLTSAAKFRKSATIVGETLGKYHPHGDAAVYETMVRLAQDFSMRYPLVRGQGNFGSMDGDSAAAMRYCLTGDALVLTDQGIKPIREISLDGEETIDCKILNYQGRRIKTSKFFDSGKHRIIEIETEQGYKLKGSRNHPVLCWKLNDFGFPAIEWKLLKDILKGDCVLINRNFSLFSKKNLKLSVFHPKNSKYKDIILPEEMNQDLAFLLGALVSEGSFHQKQISFNNKDVCFYAAVKEIIKAQFPKASLYEREIKGGCQELSLYHQKAVKFLENIGLKNVRSDLKEIPFAVLLSKKETIKKFLISLFEGDGCVVVHQDKRHNGRSIELNYNSKSQKLIFQLKTLLLNFSIITNSPFRDKRNGCYKLSISGQNNIKRFEKEIGFFSKKKKTRLNQILAINSERMSQIDYIPFLNEYLRDNYSSQFVQKNNFDRYNKLKKNYNQITKILRPKDKALVDWLLKNRFFFNKIKNVSRLDKEEKVYSIKVNGRCHSFIANGFINHNTEAKLAKIAEEMLVDIDKETVNWVDNYDGTRQEPTVLPAKLPQLLLNGTMGIAVGMATDIPPHNLKEVADATIYLIDHPEATTADLCAFIKGPDFPTGGAIYDRKSIIEAYGVGKGPIVMRAKVDIVEKKSSKGGQFQIIITEMTYRTNKADLVAKIADLVRDKKVQGIKDLRDESDKDGVRVAIDLKSDAYPQKILNRLYKLTDLQKTFHLNMLALVNGLQPQVLSLKEVLEEYIKHRQEVVVRRTKYILRQAQERAHILEGLNKALDHINAVIETIKKSANRETAHKNLMKNFKLSDRQATAILEMKLQTLAGLERKKIKEELEEKLKLIKELETLLGDPKKILKLIKDEVSEVKEKYGDQRRTKVYNQPLGKFSEEELIPEEESVIILTKGGYIKRVNPKSYKAQKRGGTGVAGITPREEDAVGFFLSASTHDSVLFFTDRGRVFQSRAYDIPEASRVARGQAIVNILQLAAAERITALVAVNKKQSANYLVMATESGIIKKTKIDDFANVRRNGLIALTLHKTDKLRWANLAGTSDEIILTTAKGQSIRFKGRDIRPMGRTAAGVKGIKLKEGDTIVGMDVIKADSKDKLLVVTENGFGKRTDLKSYKTQKRGGMGIKTAKITVKTGNIVVGRVVGEELEDLIAISKKGQVIRTRIKDISTLSRATQGVKIMRMKGGDKVASIVFI